MLSKRQSRILSLLEESKRYLTAEEIAQSTGVSKRTVHSELKSMEEDLNSIEKILIRKRGIGIAIENKKNLESKTFELNSDKSRLQVIMENLLFGEKIISYNRLSELLFVSKSSISKELEKVQKILGGIDLKSSAKGSYLNGDESQLREAYIRFNHWLFTQCTSNNTYSDWLGKLEEYYSENVVAACKDVLISYLKNNWDFVSEVYVQSLLSSLIVQTYRMYCGEFVKCKPSGIESEEAVNRILNEVSDRLNIDFNEIEKEYFAGKLISFRFEPAASKAIEQQLVHQIVLDMYSVLKLTINNDCGIKAMLENHMFSMLYRLRNHQKIENPFVDQIKEEYGVVFQTIWIVLQKYESLLGVQFNDEEIAYLTIYFQTFIEENRTIKKLLVVCQLGVATSELIIRKLINYLPATTKVERVSKQQFERMKDLEEYSLILTTITLDRAKPNTIKVSPYLTKNELQMIRKVLDENESSHQNVQKGISNRYGGIFNQEIDCVKKEWTSKVEIIEAASNVLFKEGFVSEKFKDGILIRENLGGTDLPIGIAIPHGKPQDGYKTTILPVTLKRKIKWDEFYVDIVFFICICEEDRMKTKKIIQNIYSIMEDKELLRRIRNCKSMEEFFITFEKEGDLL